MAQRHEGLEFSGDTLQEEGGFQLAGTYRSCDVEVETGSDGTDTYTLYKVALPPQVPSDLVLAEHDFLSKIGTMFGGRDVEIGNQKFDDIFVVKTEHPKQVRDVLEHDGLRTSLYTLHDDNRHPHIEDGWLQIRTDGLVLAAEQHERHLDTVTEHGQNIRESLETTGRPNGHP